MIKNRKLVRGVGINDADYPTTRHEELPKVNGKRQQKLVWRCPYYSRWSGMLDRCYSKASYKRQPTYRDVTVCKEWLTFSNFRKWMVTQDWEGKALDKDYLILNNKVYSPEACVFVYKFINDFILDRGATRGKYLIGCRWVKNDSKFVAECCNPMKKHGDERTPYVGHFSTELEAHLAWKRRKHEYSIELANSIYVTDERVRSALLIRYKNYSTVEDHIR